MSIQATTMKEMIINVFKSYCIAMGDMHNRSPGTTTKKYLFVDKPVEDWDKVPFSPNSCGCGASMRSMCIGLRFPHPNQVTNLVITGVETGRLSHHNPCAYLASVIGGGFTSYALQGIPVQMWGAKARDELIPLAKAHVSLLSRESAENVKAFEYSEQMWERYLRERGIDEPENRKMPVFPSPYGFYERDKFYQQFTGSRNPGIIGMHSVIIAYDAILGVMNMSPAERWKGILERAAIHSGDNDSTGAIACGWFGALYGLEDVNPKHYQNIEYRERMEDLARRLFQIAHSETDPLRLPAAVGQL